MINIQKLIEEANENGYQGDKASAKVCQDIVITFAILLLQWKKAGIRNKSANTQARGAPSVIAVKPI